MSQADVFRYAVAALIAAALLAGVGTWSWVAWQEHKERRTK